MKEVHVTVPMAFYRKATRQSSLSCFIEVGARHKKYLHTLAMAAGEKTGREVALREMLAHILDYVMKQEKDGTRKHRPVRHHHERKVRRRVR